MKYLLTVLFFNLFIKENFSQNRLLLNENFERDIFIDSLNTKQFSKRYAITTYRPKEKTVVNIYSYRTDTPYNIFFTENICATDSTNKEHGFYVGIDIYDKVMPSNRTLLVVRLDTALQADKNYSISYDAKYHQYTKYRIDSMQVLLVSKEEDIKLWLASREYSGMYIDFSMQNINNKDWNKIQKDFTAQREYTYIVIGNLQPDDQIKVYKADDCSCGKRPKGFWDYSELFLDNIMIVEK